MTRICVDAVSGECDYQVVLKGIEDALAADGDLEVLVAGGEDVVVPFCQEHPRAYPLVTSQIIGMDEHPVEAFRSKKDSSIVRGLKSIADQEAEGFFSPGNTGAIFTAATFILGHVKGIKRPALSILLPGINGHQTVFLDLGANADCRPEMLVGFARMGAAYCSYMFGKKRPGVYLLSNGAEAIKGNELVRNTHQLLLDTELNFKGNCEGVDLLYGDMDVAVTDGFTGNCCLKTVEGTAKFFASRLKAAAKSNLLMAAGAGLLKPALKKVATELSGDAYGGAVLLGCKAPVFIGHGHTSREAIKNGCLVCAKACRDQLAQKVADSVAFERKQAQEASAEAQA